MHTCRDPKDGELCLSGAKPEETLMEAHSDTVILRVLVHDVLPISLSHTRFRPKGVMVIARRGF